MITLTTAASRMLSTAAAVAVAMGGATTTAEATAIAGLLEVLAKRNDLSVPPLQLLSPTNGAQIGPT